MNQRGTDRNVDELGRVVIPAEIRKALGLQVGDEWAVSCEVVRPVQRMGRITIPEDIRSSENLTTGTPVKWEMVDEVEDLMVMTTPAGRRYIWRKVSLT